MLSTLILAPSFLSQIFNHQPSYRGVERDVRFRRPAATLVTVRLWWRAPMEAISLYPVVLMRVVSVVYPIAGDRQLQYLSRQKEGNSLTSRWLRGHRVGSVGQYA